MPLLLTSGVNLRFPEVITLSSGLLFFLLVQLPIILIFVYWGYLISELKVKNSILLVLFLFVIMVAEIGIEFYLFPKVNFFNPIATYISGVIYDDVVIITTDMVLYRVVSFLMMTLIPFAVRFLQKRGFIKSFRIEWILVLVIAIDLPIRLFLGLVDNSKSIEAKLITVREEERVIIHFAQNIDDEEKFYLSMLHRYYIVQLDSFFHSAPKKKFNSYIFANADEKKGIYGTANADMARIWDNSCFVDRKTVYKNIKHELAHLYTSQFGLTPFKVSSNTSLLEGIATAASGLEGKNDIDFLAFQIIQAKPNLDIGAMVDNSSFFSQNAGISYNISGSFCRWLISKYGMEKFISYYRGDDYKNAFNSDISSDIKLYIAYLTNQKYDKDTVISNFYKAAKATVQNKFYKYIGTESYKIQIALQDNSIELANLLKRINDLILLNESSDLHFFRYSILYKMKHYDEAELELRWLEKSFRYSNYAQNRLFELYAAEQKLDKIKTLLELNSNKEPNPDNEKLAFYNLMYQKGDIINFLNSTPKIKKESLVKVLERENVNFVFPELLNYADKSDLHFLESGLISSLTPFMNIQVLAVYTDFLLKNGSTADELIRFNISKMERILSSGVKYRSYYNEKINFFKFYIENRNSYKRIEK